MAHESPAFLRNQRQLGTAETTARLTVQLPRPSQLCHHNKGNFYISSSNKKVLDLLTLHKQYNKKNKKMLTFYFCAIGAGKISGKQNTVAFFKFA